jgi:hypothetical protein
LMRKGRHHLSKAAFLVAASLFGALYLSGCGGGGSTPPKSVQDSGTKTVLVNATSGSISSTIPILVNIQ